MIARGPQIFGNDEADARLAQIALASCFEREAMAVGFDQLHCL
jgi:hypothetical protein